MKFQKGDREEKERRQKKVDKKNRYKIKRRIIEGLR